MTNTMNEKNEKLEQILCILCKRKILYLSKYDKKYVLNRHIQHYHTIDDIMDFFYNHVEESQS